MLVRLIHSRKQKVWALVCLLAGAFAFWAGCAARGQRYEYFITPTPLVRRGGPSTLVIGFMGGREPWDNEKRGVRRLALTLRAMELPGLHVETVENARRYLAVQLVRNALDQDKDGQLDAEERASARVIVYGQSFGGAAVVKLANELEEMQVPIALTVQVDSVGVGDADIPPNVRCAANLFQGNGFFIRGEPEIRAEDPARTKIIGNFEYDYSDKDIDLSEVSWLKKIFRTAHTKMDFDPEVWTRVEGIILHAIRKGTCEDPVQSREAER